MKKLFLVLSTLAPLLLIADITSATTINMTMTGQVQGLHAQSVSDSGLRIGDEVTVNVIFDNDGTTSHRYDQAGNIVSTNIISGPAELIRGVFLSDAVYAFSSNILQAFSVPTPTNNIATEFYQTAQGDDSWRYLAFHFQSVDFYFHVTALPYSAAHGGVF